MERFPTLGELAKKKMWWAVQNLIRRGQAKEWEFCERVEGKTAAAWAEHEGCLYLLNEIRYYVSI